MDSDTHDESPRTPLPGSTRGPAPDAIVTGRPDTGGPVELTVVLRRRSDGTLGAETGDLDTVSASLRDLGLAIVSADDASRRIRVRGDAGTVSSVFGTQFEGVTSRAPDGSRTTHRQRTGGLELPAQLSGRVLAVLGIDDRPQARSQFRVARPAATATSFTPLQLGEVYAFPPGTDGSGQRIAIVELGGGYTQPELDTYFAGLGITGPRVTAVGVDGGANRPERDPQGADGEVLLDIEVAGALAPGADLVVYFAPNSDAGFLDAVSEAVHATPTPAALSISWGQNEDDWTAQARAAMDAAFADAVSLGVVVTAAAGDNGSGDNGGDGRDHCDFPASSPNVLACGGTSLTADRETVWNSGSGGGATGGGVSAAFPRPGRQADVGVPDAPTSGGGRGVPDVCGNADPQTGYQVLVDGTRTVIGGTSAVSPLWAALVARLAQSTGGPLHGFLDTLYSGSTAGSSPPGLRDVTVGDNGGYSAGPGWDACTGLGSPIGTDLLARLRSGG